MNVQKKPRRKLGMYRDKIKILDDFDAPLLEEILRAFEGWDDPEEEPQVEK